MILEAHHADIPPCAECVQWQFDGQWKPVTHLTPEGRVRTPRAGKPPCWKCPKGPEPFAGEPTARTLRAIDYFHLCRADSTGLLPRDRITVENHALIERLREQLARADRADPAALLALLFGSGGKKR